MYLQDNEDRQWLAPPVVDVGGLGTISTLHPEDDDEPEPEKRIGFQPPPRKGLMTFTRPGVFRNEATS